MQYWKLGVGVLVLLACCGTVSAQEGGENATIEFAGNDSTPESFTVSEVYLPEGGFVGIHGEGLAAGGVQRSSLLAVSEKLDPGDHTDLTIPVSNRIGDTGPNRSQVNLTRANVSAVAYRDENDDDQFDFYDSYGSIDPAYEVNNSPVMDTDLVVIDANMAAARNASPTSASVATTTITQTPTVTQTATQTQVQTTATSTSTATPTSTATATSTQTSTPTLTPASESSSGTGDGLSGVFLGVMLGIIALILIVLAFVRVM